MNNEEILKMMREMKREILDRGYVTHALTCKDSRVLGIGRKYYEKDYSEKDAPFYWSEVYCETNGMCIIIRKGMLLANPSDDELERYYIQSMVNLNDDSDKLPSVLPKSLRL